MRALTRRMKLSLFWLFFASRASLYPLLRSSIRLAMLAVSICSAGINKSSYCAEAGSGTPMEFLQRYCLDCHGEKKQKGDRRFDHFKLPVTQLDELLDVDDIIDQLNLGDMAPKKARQPSTGERAEM